LEPSNVRPLPKPPKPQPSTIQDKPWRIHRRVNFTTTLDTPVQTLPSLKTTQSSSGQPHTMIGTTCLGKVLHSSDTNDSKRERASKKRKLTAEATGTRTVDSIKQAIPSKSAPNQWATTPQHHEDPTQFHKSSRHQRNMQNNIEPAPPSQIWPNNLISILQRIMATSCPPPDKAYFRIRSINQSGKQELHLAQAHLWGRPPESSRHPTQLAAAIRVRIQTN
jgi:hypothetical protein